MNRFSNALAISTRGQFVSRLSWRSLLCLSCLVVLSTQLFAQVPSGISHNGSLTINGEAVTDASASLTFSLFTSETGGTAIWTETQSGIAVTDGRYDVQLGSETSLSTIDFDVPYWLETTYLDNALTPRIRMTAEPFTRTAAVGLTAPWDGITGMSSTFSDGSDGDTARSSCNPWVIPYMEYGASISQIIYAANTSYAANVVMSAVDDQGNFYDLGSFTANYGITRLNLTISSRLSDLGFTSGKVAIGIIARSDESSLYVFAANTINSQRVEVPVLCI